MEALRPSVLHVVRALSRGDGALSTTVFESYDGALSFELEATPVGLCVRRQRVQSNARVRLQHTALFADLTSFERWMDRDGMRFDYPLIHSTVKRKGAVFLGAASDVGRG